MRYLAPLALVATVSGCTGLAAYLNQPPASPPTINAFDLMPMITPVENTPQAITKGGITATATPVDYVEVQGVHNEERETGRGNKCQYVSGGVNITPVRSVEITSNATFSPSPDRLVFLVKLNNQLPRVFRGAGTVVQFNVSGSLVSVAPSQYASLTNLILPPRNESAVQLIGPPLSAIPDGATIGLFLYDVVTNTDAAGNITEKQNFEWYYKYSTQSVAHVVPIQKQNRDDPLGPTVRAARCTT